MRISTRTRYGVRFLLMLASASGKDDERLTIQQIARSQGISEKYLESIATRLKKHGFVCAAKGTNGGYWLARPIDKTTVGDVIRAMEAIRRDEHCMTDYDKCPNRGDCPLEACWVSLKSAIERAADNITLDTLDKTK